MLSLRLRLIIFFVLTSALVFAIAAIASWKETGEKVDEFFDTYQMALARQLSAADWSRTTPQIQNITDKLIKRIDNAEDEDEAIGFAVFNRQGQMVFHDNENGKDFSFASQSGRFAEQTVDDEKWRLVWLRSADGQYVIAVGQELDYRNDIVWDMTEEFMLPWGIGIVSILLIMIAVITRELLPLKRLSDNLNRRDPDDLSPLDEPRLPTEILPLINALNQLLKKIKAMLERERSFIADSAHELRTPLTALKVQLDVAKLAGDNTETRQKALQKLENGIDRSARLVEQLLALSKAQSTEQSAVKEKIFWKSIIMQIIEEYQEIAAEKQQSITAKLNGKGPFSEGNPLLASLIVRNLLDNAVKYSPPQAKITVSLTPRSLSVTNSGVKVAEKHLRHLGNRFYRPAGQTQNGSGLGLSIVSRISGLYRADFSCRNTAEGFCVKISAANLSE